MDKKRLLIGMIILTALAGLINALAISYFATTVSHVTGLVSNFAINSAEFDWEDALWFLGVSGSFFLGAMLAGFITEERKFYLYKRYGVLIIVIGISVAIATILLPYFDKYTMFIFALLMGLQNGMVVSFKGVVVRMTHMTGNFTDFGVYLGYQLRGKKKEERITGIVPACAILGFIVGGVVGIVLAKYIGYNTFYIASGIYVIIGILYLVYERTCDDKNFNGIPDEEEDNPEENRD